MFWRINVGNVSINVGNVNIGNNINNWGCIAGRMYVSNIRLTLFDGELVAIEAA